MSISLPFFYSILSFSFFRRGNKPRSNKTDLHTNQLFPTLAFLLLRKYYKGFKSNRIMWYATNQLQSAFNVSPRRREWNGPSAHQLKTCQKMIFCESKLAIGWESEWSMMDGKANLFEERRISLRVVEALEKEVRVKKGGEREVDGK